MNISSLLITLVTIGSWLINHVACVDRFDEYAHVHGIIDNENDTIGINHKIENINFSNRASNDDHSLGFPSGKAVAGQAFTQVSTLSSTETSEVHHTSLRGSVGYDHRRNLDINEHYQKEDTSTEPTESVDQPKDAAHISPGLDGTRSVRNTPRVLSNTGPVVDPDDEGEFVQEPISHQSVVLSINPYTDDDWMIPDESFDDNIESHESFWIDHPIRLEDEHFYANSTENPKIGKGTWVVVPSSNPAIASYSYVSSVAIVTITTILAGMVPCW